MNQGGILVLLGVDEEREEKKNQHNNPQISASD